MAPINHARGPSDLMGLMDQPSFLAQVAIMSTVLPNGNGSARNMKLICKSDGGSLSGKILVHASLKWFIWKRSPNRSFTRTNPAEFGTFAASDVRCAKFPSTQISFQSYAIRPLWCFWNNENQIKSTGFQQWLQKFDLDSGVNLD